MILLMGSQLKKRAWSYRLIAMWLAVSLSLLAGTTWYSTAESKSLPASAPGAGDGRLPATSPRSFAQSTTFAPFLNIIPSQDGTEIFISANGVGELGGTVFANLGVGPGHDKGGWTMVYSSTTQAYLAAVGGFTPNTGASGPLSITTTLGLDTGTVEFNRAYVPASTAPTISSIDGNLQLSLVSTDTLPSDAYILIVPSYAPPGPPPPGHRLVSSAYSVRDSGASPVTAKPMDLRLYYNDTILTGADPHTLAIFAWDAYRKRWDNLGGHLFYNQHYLSVATSRFTTYALMTAPAWRDDFTGFSGLVESTGVTLSSLEDGMALVLSDLAISGTAVSSPITPTTAFAGWGNLTFAAVADPPTTTLTMDVLSLSGDELLPHVVSGTSLASLDPSQYPSLQLRATLSSTTPGETPFLDQWQLTWQVEEHKVYLPLVLQQGTSE